MLHRLAFSYDYTCNIVCWWKYKLNDDDDDDDDENDDDDDDR